MTFGVKNLKNAHKWHQAIIKAVLFKNLFQGAKLGLILSPSAQLNYILTSNWYVMSSLHNGMHLLYYAVEFFCKQIHAAQE